MNENMRREKNVYHIIFVLLVFLQTTKHSSAQNTTTTVSPNSTSTADPASLSYLTLPKDVTAALGDPAEFQCGVPKTSPGLTFTFYGSNRNYILTCPSGHVEDILQALEGSCEEKNAELLAVWTLKVTSLPNDGTGVMCQQKGSPEAPTATLHVYNKGLGSSLMIGLLVGCFFGVLLVFGLLYLALRRSERLQRCFVGEEDDLIEIVEKYQAK